MPHILVVDDNADVAEAVSLLLAEAGHKAETAGSLAAARTLLKSGNFDGVIIDVWMDGENGLEFASEVADHTPMTPFIVMSGGGPGRSLEAVTARADSLGALAVLFKPFDDEELLSAVNTMMRAAAD